MNKKIFLLLILTALFAMAANAQTRSRRTPVKRAPVKPVSLATGAVKMPSGLTYLITKRGFGRRPKSGDSVEVHYTGTLTNGVKFDSSRDRNQTFSFNLGKREVIRGWDEGIAKLRVGDQAILIIPPAIGYGARGAGGGVIPPDATLIFIVELVDIKPQPINSPR